MGPLTSGRGGCLARPSANELLLRAAAARCNSAYGMSVAGQAPLDCRLRQACKTWRDVAGFQAPGFEVRDLHAVQQDVGCARGLHQPPPLHLRATGRHGEGGEAARLGGLLQCGRADFLVHLLHSSRRCGHQPHRREHRDLLRFGLEPRHGPAGHGPGTPHRPDKRGSHLPLAHCAHGGGEHLEETAAEAGAGRRRRRPRPLQRRFFAGVEQEGLGDDGQRRPHDAHGGAPGRQRRLPPRPRHLPRRQRPGRFRARARRRGGRRGRADGAERADGAAGDRAGAEEGLRRAGCTRARRSRGRAGARGRRRWRARRIRGGLVGAAAASGEVGTPSSSRAQGCRAAGSTKRATEG
mmetsp:Transcript_40628/g.130729  ORF Transcript_40628/g.130729 Transcript_40628/m.130729 type:complete len:352 (-) Transcript_40628:50-1105(-)